MKNLSKEKGVSLVVAIAIMVVTAVLGSAMVSMLGTTSRGSLDYLYATRDLGIAQGGMNWQMMELCNLSNLSGWANAANQTNLSLGNGTFSVVLTNKTALFNESGSTANVTALNITVTANITGTVNQTITRTMSQRVLRLPSAAKFALFWGKRTGTALTLTNINITGGVWSQGSASIPATSSVSRGTVYCPSSETVSGAGSYTNTTMVFPYFGNFTGTMNATFSNPQMNITYYTALTDTYNTTIAGCASGTTNNTNSDIVLINNTLCFQTFNTNTVAASTVNITGAGTIVANRDMLLNTAAGSGRTLNIRATTGDILLLAGRSITINAATGTNAVNITSNNSAGFEVRMYALSTNNNNQLIILSNNNTNVTGGLLLGGRNITVQNGTKMFNVIMFVNDVGVTNNNGLLIRSSGTAVGSASSPCSVISVGRGSPSLQIAENATVTGLVFQDDTGNIANTTINGTSSSNRVTINGALIANQFNGNAINNATIIYNWSLIPDPPPQGFGGFVTKDSDTWSGN